MNNEYVFYTKDLLDFPLDDSIDVVNEPISEDKGYIVSNSEEVTSLIYAPEINFYIRNSEDDLLQKIKNIKALYDIRSANFDYAKDIDFEQEVNEKLLIVTSDENFAKYKEILENKKFRAISLEPDMVLDVEGHIGELRVTLKKDDKEYEIDCDQIVWENAPDFAMKQSGVFDPALESLESIVNKLEKNLEGYRYKNYVVYDPNICQYHERREEICGKCAEVCPTVAILKEDESKHLILSHVDCHGCGGCVSVCPSGAMDYAQMPREGFGAIKEFYEDRVALIIPRKMELESLHVKTPKGVLPLAIEGEKFLSEMHFLSLIQTSGNPVIFFSDFISKGTGDSIYIINEIFQRKYNKQAVFICKNEEELKDIFPKLESMPECKWGFNEEGMRKREIFSARLAHLVGDEDLGVVKTGEHIHYGDIIINEDNCTLCLSCVGACNVRALTAHPEDNTLRFNPSICTNCGYCAPSCPEKDCLSIVEDELHLKPEYFTQRVMAKDELFKCVECGVPFATKKSIEKIASIMIPKFGDDKEKIRALYCCADCKAKVTMKSYLQGKG